MKFFFQTVGFQNKVEPIFLPKLTMNSIKCKNLLLKTTARTDCIDI